MPNILQTWSTQICLAFLLDSLLGDPESFFHPVRWIGKTIIILENILRRRFKNLRRAGVVLAACLVCIVLAAVGSVLFLADRFSPWASCIVRIYIFYACLSARSLAVEVQRVLIPLKAGDLGAARHWLSRIVGRDTQNLDEKEILRAALETTAESTVDGVVSVLFYAFLGGPLLAMVFKTVSTLDSMVGYKNARYEAFGWASAKLDDIFNYIPARIGAVLISIASIFLLHSPVRAMRVVLRDAKKQPSPNSGYPEAAFAGALGVCLGGQNTYGGQRVAKATLGDARENFSVAKVEESLRLMFVTTILTVALGVLVHVFFEWK